MERPVAGGATTGTLRRVLVRALGPDEVDRYRTVRLEALRADPQAFASSYERELAFDDATWAARLAGYDGRPGTVFVAEDGGRVDGMVGVGLAPTPGEAVLWGMWVRPEARGTGAAAALVDAVVGWARRRDAAAVVLWVMRANAAAIARYERSGFRPAPDQAGAPTAACATELAMRLDL